jgi:aminoglycoside 3-N-acetyltransferase
MLERAAIITALRALGVEAGGVLLVHASYRALGGVSGGPRAVIDALLEHVGKEGTLVMPALSDGPDDEPFYVQRSPCLGMGVIAETFRGMPGVLRSDNPHSFAAHGPHAEAITAPHPIDDPHGPGTPVDRVRALDGQVLLLGVDHDANTTVHLAEALAGVPYRLPHYVTVLARGVARRIDYEEIDCCCRGFAQVGGWLEARGLQRRGLLGSATLRLMRSRDVVDVAVQALEEDATRFLCAPDAGCEECDRARASIPNRA